MDEIHCLSISYNVVARSSVIVKFCGDWLKMLQLENGKFALQYFECKSSKLAGQKYHCFNVVFVFRVLLSTDVIAHLIALTTHSKHVATGLCRKVKKNLLWNVFCVL